MTNGETPRLPAGTPELDIAQPPLPSADQSANQQFSPRNAGRLEQVRAYPMCLDISFAEEGAIILARLSEGIYRFTDAADEYLSSEATDVERKLFYNAIQTNDRTFTLLNGEFYVKGDNEASGDMTTLMRAEAIVDRIAELIGDTTDVYLDDAMAHIRQENDLALAGTPAFVLAEAVARRHPRLQMHREKSGSDARGRERIDAVLDYTPDLPATVGECLDRLAETQSGVARTGTAWVKQMRGRFLYTPETIEALYAAIKLDPRFEITRGAHSVQTNTYLLRPDDAKWPPLTSKADLLKTPPQELARRILDLCATCDLQVTDNLIGKLIRGTKIVKNKKQDIIETLLHDPRVLATDHPEYIQIAHTPEDAQKYEQLTEIVHLAIDSFLEAFKDDDVKTVAAEAVHSYIREIAHERHIALTAQVRHMLQKMVVIDPHVVHVQDGKYYLTEHAQRTRPGAISEIPAPTLEPERVAVLQAAIDGVVTRYVDDAASTMLVERLVNLAEAALTQRGESLTAQERFYLAMAFTQHERFEEIGNRPGVLHIRPQPQQAQFYEYDWYED